MARESSGNRHSTCTSSMVVSSMPGITEIPYSCAAFMMAGQFLHELWSVSAITSSPFKAAIPTMLAGVISSSPQGERQEWMCRS